MLRVAALVRVRLNSIVLVLGYDHIAHIGGQNVAQNLQALDAQVLGVVRVRLVHRQHSHQLHHVVGHNVANYAKLVEVVRSAGRHRVHTLHRNQHGRHVAVVEGLAPQVVGVPQGEKVLHHLFAHQMVHQKYLRLLVTVAQCRLERSEIYVVPGKGLFHHDPVPARGGAALPAGVESHLVEDGKRHGQVEDPVRYGLIVLHLVGGHQLGQTLVALGLVVLALDAVHVHPEAVVLCRVAVLVQVHIRNHLQSVGLRLQRRPAKRIYSSALRQSVFPEKTPEHRENLLLGQFPGGPENHNGIGGLIVEIDR